MSTDSTKRKMAAILSADVKGYSRLMSADEEGTVKSLNNCREIISRCVHDHSGRVVDSPGDNVLAEFASTVEAVKCAVKIQENLKIRNAGLPESRRMEFRIGVNLGDVIEEEGRIYGDGVNIAARLEGLAEGCGICVSGTAFDQVKNKVSVGYQYLGKQTVKNIPDPVRAYKVLMEPEAAGKVIGEQEPKQTRWGWKALAAVAVLVLVVGGLVWNFYGRTPRIEPASKDKMAFPLPDVPSIAVLPFVNMSNDPKQDGMTEDIITALSKVPRLFVIARNSTFTYKGKPVKVKQVSEELGVRYVLEGSLQRSGDRLRINAQLIDALTGNHLWAERYDRDLKDIFALQDEITINVLNGIRVKLTTGAEVSMSQKYAEKYYRGKQGLDCYLKLTEASGYLERFNIEDTNLARRMVEAAVAMCPENPMGYLSLGWVYHRDFALGNTKSPRESLEKGKELAQKALAMDDSLPGAHILLCALYRRGGEYDKAIAEGERAVALDPSATAAIDNYASSLMIAGRPEEAIPLFQKAIRLNPFAPSWLYRDFGAALRDTGRFEEAVSAYNKAIQITPDNILAHVCLAGTYIMMGREKEARAEAAEVLRINPKFSVDSWAKTFAYKDHSQQDKIVNAVRKAGLPDKPPLPLPDKPSIAVLPFVNMSDDKNQEYFSDGLTEEIITALSKTPKLFVIARNSTFVYKGKPVNVQHVSRELGVKYVLEGSVRRSGDQLRITAQLIDATTGNHLWAERYDREMKDIFEIQDEVTMKILTSLQVKLTEGEGFRMTARGTKNLDAYLKFIQGFGFLIRMNPDDHIQAAKYFQEAIDLDRKYAAPYASMGLILSLSVLQGRSKSPKESIEAATKFAEKAHELDQSYPTVYLALGGIERYKGQFDKAINTYERGLALDPNNQGLLTGLGLAYLGDGRPEEAILHLKRAIRVNPLDPSMALQGLGQVYCKTGRYEEAIPPLKQAIRNRPQMFQAHLELAACYAGLGKEEEARAAAAEVLKMHPKFTVEGYAAIFPLKDKALKERYLENLRKAGMK
jgi:adenylate cyclase